MDVDRVSGDRYLPLHGEGQHGRGQGECRQCLSPVGFRKASCL